MSAQQAPENDGEMASGTKAAGASRSTYPVEVEPISEVEPTADAVKDLLSKLRPGLRVDDKYDVQAIIGRGGMGVVVAARHLDLGRDVALKFLCSSSNGTTNGDEMRARFRREAQISAKLRNEHITRVLDVGSFAGASFMVMERLEGNDLRRKLREAGGKLPLNVAMNYVLQLCEGIAEAHAHGIVHRDLKPSNLFITHAPDGTDLLKILDFGISKWSDAEVGELTKDGMVLGSPKYMAPEQVFGATTIDTRADVWSIGAIFYQMLAGRTPYVETTLARFCQEIMSGPPPRLDTVADVPKAVADVVERCFEQKPEDRMSSVADLAGALLDAVEEPGNSIRERLGAIMSSAGGAFPVPSSRTFSSTSISGSARSVVPGSTKLSPSATPTPAPAPQAAKSPIVPISIAIAVAAVAVAVIVKVLGTKAPVVAAAPVAPVVTATAVATTLAPTPPATPAATTPATAAATPLPATAAAAPATGAAKPHVVYVPVAAKATGATAPATATPPPKKNDDEIPTMR
jgi:serine/threonine protein kinase